MIPSAASAKNTTLKKPLVYSAEKTPPIFHSNTFSYLAMILTMAQITTPYIEKHGAHPRLTCTGCERMLSLMEFFAEAQSALLLKIMVGSDEIEIFKSFINKFAELLIAENYATIAAFMIESLQNKDIISRPCPSCNKNSWVYKSGDLNPGTNTKDHPIQHTAT
jgi:hypothetical protein